MRILFFLIVFLFSGSAMANTYSESTDRVQSLTYKNLHNSERLTSIRTPVNETLKIAREPITDETDELEVNEMMGDGGGY